MKIGSAMGRLLCAGVLALCGCGQSNKPAAPAPAPPPPAKTPDKSAAEGDAPPSEPLVKEAVKRPHDLDYARDEKLPFGTLRGQVRLVGEGIQLPVKKPLEVAVAGAQPGEAEYYKNVKMNEPTPLRWIKAGAGKTFLLTGTSVCVKGIRTGRRPALERPKFLVTQGLLIADHGRGRAVNINFGAPMERAQMGTNDTYPCDLVVKNFASGAKLFEGTAVSLQGGKTATGEAVDPRATEAKLIQSEPLTEMGAYSITCKRHPWQAAWLVLTDNPYCTVAEGEFKIDEIPPGTHKLEVWHPDFEPVQKTYEFEIKDGETQELLVEFKYPPADSSRKK